MGTLGWPQILIILAVIILLFGSRKLPDLARGLGSSLRIFRAETKGMMEDEKASSETNTSSNEQPRAVEASQAPPADSADQPAREGVTDQTKRDS